MPFTFEIDSSAGIIRECWTERVEVAQLKDSCRQQWAHPDYKQGMMMISDFRKAESVITADDVWAFAVWFGNEVPPIRHAIVVTRESGFGFAKMFTLISQADKNAVNKTRIFDSYEAAEAWLAETIT